MIIRWFYISLWFYSLYSVSIRVVILSLSDFGEVSFCQISSQLGQSFCAAWGELNHESPDESQDITWKGRLEKARVEWELLTSECCILELSHEVIMPASSPSFKISYDHLWFSILPALFYMCILLNFASYSFYRFLGCTLYINIFTIIIFLDVVCK